MCPKSVQNRPPCVLKRPQCVPKSFKAFPHHPHSVPKVSPVSQCVPKASKAFPHRLHSVPGVSPVSQCVPKSSPDNLQYHQDNPKCFPNMSQKFPQSVSNFRPLYVPLWHISQVKHFGCQEAFIALITRPTINSPHFPQQGAKRT